MDIAIIISGIILSLVWLWLTVLGVIAVKYDSTLEPFQKIVQIIFVLVVPFFGSAFVMHLVNLHSPEVIPKKWVPWPFRSIVYGKERLANKYRDDNENNAIDLDVSQSQHSHMDECDGGD